MTTAPSEHSSSAAPSRMSSPGEACRPCPARRARTSHTPPLAKEQVEKCARDSMDWHDDKWIRE